MIYQPYQWGGGGYSKLEVDTLLNDKANSSHTHSKSEITDFPTIPSKTSDLTNDLGFISSEIDSIGEGWVRFKCSLQICWGVVVGVQFEPFNGHYEKTVSYPRIFLANTEPTVNITQWRATGNLTQNVNVYDVSTSFVRIETDEPWGVFYTVFGKWK